MKWIALLLIIGLAGTACAVNISSESFNMYLDVGDGAANISSTSYQMIVQVGGVVGSMANTSHNSSLGFIQYPTYDTVSPSVSADTVSMSFISNTQTLTYNYTITDAYDDVKGCWITYTKNSTAANLTGTLTSTTCNTTVTLTEDTNLSIQGYGEDNSGNEGNGSDNQLITHDSTLTIDETVVVVDVTHNGTLSVNLTNYGSLSVTIDSVDTSSMLAEWTNTTAVAWGSSTLAADTSTTYDTNLTLEVVDTTDYACAITDESVLSNTRNYLCESELNVTDPDATNHDITLTLTGMTNWDNRREDTINVSEASSSIGINYTTSDTNIVITVTTSHGSSLSEGSHVVKVAYETPIPTPETGMGGGGGDVSVEQPVIIKVKGILFSIEPRETKAGVDRPMPSEIYSGDSISYTVTGLTNVDIGLTVREDGRAYTLTSGRTITSDKFITTDPAGDFILKTNETKYLTIRAELPPDADEEYEVAVSVIGTNQTETIELKVYPESYRPVKLWYNRPVWTGVVSNQEVSLLWWNILVLLFGLLIVGIVFVTYSGKKPSMRTVINVRSG